MLGHVKVDVNNKDTAKTLCIAKTMNSQDNPFLKTAI